MPSVRQGTMAASKRMSLTRAVCVIGVFALGACTPVTSQTPDPARSPGPRSGDASDRESIVDPTLDPLPPELGVPGAGDTLSLTEVEEALTDAELPELTEVTPRYLDEILTSPFAEADEIRERTQFWLERWTNGGRGYFQRYLNRMGRYSALVDAEIEAQGLPRALRYLPIVESGYNPVAVSPVGATGLWQFMSPTARWRGLRVDALVDERRDPEAATREALRYLSDLREQFGSWFLALAAYNSGPGRVAGVIRRHGGEAALGDSLFWALGENLPNETRHFVPKLFAATELATNPERYGFEPPRPGNEYRYVEVDVPDATSLEVVAEAAGADPEEVVALNPFLRQKMTPPGRFTVRIPEGTGVDFAARYAEIPEDERITYLQHRVARGETLSHIAARYGVSVSNLRAANPGISPRRMRVGQRIIVPAGGSAAARRVASAQAGTATVPSVRTVTHVVSRGESLWTIAQRYGVSVRDLRSWNDFREGQTIYPGNRVEIRSARVIVYRVQTGDTLSEIAERHGISTRALAEENGLTLRSVIRPGQEMRIPGN